MTAGKDERLSALVDDEVTAFESRRLCGELVRNADDRGRWERYHLIGAALRGEVSPGYRPDFADGVMKAIAEEAPVIAPRHGIRRMAGIAAAASIAVVGFVAVQTMMQEEPATTTPVIATIEQAPRPVSPIQLASEEIAAPVAGELDAYLVNHAEYAARPGMVSYARVVSYEPNAR